MHVNQPEETETGDILNDALFRRNKEVEELYNLTIEYGKGDGNTLQSSVLADEDYYDMCIATIAGTGLSVPSNSGLLMDLCTIDELSLDKPWWSQLMYDSLSIGGKLYYTSGDISPAMYCAPGCYYANKPLLADHKIECEDIYASVHDGSWTIDKMISLTKDMDRDLNNDGVMSEADDYFGQLNEVGTLSTAVHLVGAGVKTSEIDKDGKLVLNFNNEYTISVIEKLQKILTNFTPKDIHTAFMNDRIVFLKHYVSSAYTRYRDMKSDFLILPMPKYDEKQESYYSLVNTWCTSFVGVPKTADAEKIGFIMEALAYKSYVDIRPQVYDVAFKAKGARNEEDASMLDIIFDTLYLDFNSFLDFGGAMTALNNALFNEKGLASEYASIESAATAEIEKFTNTWMGN